MIWTIMITAIAAVAATVLTLAILGASMTNKKIQEENNLLQELVGKERQIRISIENELKETRAAEKKRLVEETTVKAVVESLDNGLH